MYLLEIRLKLKLKNLVGNIFMIYDELYEEVDKADLFKNYDDDIKKRKIIEYASLAMDYNKNINITGANDIKIFLEQHIFDSLLALEIFKDYDNIIDVGSGAGLPSIPLAIMYEDKKFTLCESKNKKADFLLIAKEKLHLNNITVLCKNVYEIKDKYDTIISRAFSDIKTLLRIFKKLKTKNASLIAYKGKIKTIEEELKEVHDIHKYDINIIKLNSKEKERHLLIIKDK